MVVRDDSIGLAQVTKIRVKKTAEIVAGQIRNAIVRGELAVGDALPTEAHLITRFEVSRPTIREAIRILESENLLQVSRGARGGARVRSPSTELVSRALGLTLQARGTTLADVYQARTIIEPQAARLAAETRPKKAADALRKYIAKERQMLTDRTAAAPAITLFHRLLVEQCNNKTLTLLVDALHEMSEKHLGMVHKSRQFEDLALQTKRREQGLRSQEKLTELVAAGKGVEAEVHWRKHMINVADFWLCGIGENGLDVLE